MPVEKCKNVLDQFARESVQIAQIHDDDSKKEQSIQIRPGGPWLLPTSIQLQTNGEQPLRSTLGASSPYILFLGCCFTGSM